MKKRLFAVAMLLMLCAGCIFAACGGECQHNYDVVSETKATCELDGVKYLKCDKCGDEKTETIRAYGHNYPDLPTRTVEPTCTQPGKEIYVCTRCESEMAINNGRALGHDLNETIITEGTCSTPGKKKIECKRCDYEAEEDIIINHSYEKIDAEHVEPTCEKDGKDAYRCSVCEKDKYIEIIPATGHSDDGTKKEVFEPTCISAGYTVKHCERCGQDYKTDISDKIEHDFVSGVCSMCDGSELDILNAIKSESDVVYDSNEKIWTITGNMCKTPMSWGGLYFTVGAEKLQQFKDDGYASVKMTLKQKADQPATTLQLYKNSPTGTLLVTAILVEGVVNIDLTEIPVEGLTYYLSYRTHVDTGSDGCVITLEGVKAFDEDDLTTYYMTGVKYTVEQDYAKFEMLGTGNLQFGVTLRPEAVKYFTDEGFGKVVFSVVCPDGKSVEVYENAWGRYQNFYNAASKGTVSFNLADYTGKGITLHFIVYNCTDAARVNLHVRGDKAFDVNDYATYVDELGGSGISGTFTVMDNNPDGYQLQFNGEEATAVGAYVNNNFEYFTLSQDMLDYFKGEGYSKIRVTVSSKDGQGSIFGMWIGANTTAIATDPATTFMVMTFEIDLEQGFYMPNGNWNKENRGFRMAVIYDKRGVVNSDGFMIKIEPVSADNTVS